jgi:hypothetical protein
MQVPSLSSGCEIAQFLFAIPCNSATFLLSTAHPPPNHHRVVRFRSQLYPSQTKILEGATKDEIRIFEALSKGVSTRFGLLTIEKSVEKPDFIFCSSFESFQNLRLGWVNFGQRISRCLTVGERRDRVNKPHFLLKAENKN